MSTTTIGSRVGWAFKYSIPPGTGLKSYCWLWMLLENCRISIKTKLVSARFAYINSSRESSFPIYPKSIACWSYQNSSVYLFPLQNPQPYKWIIGWTCKTLELIMSSKFYNGRRIPNPLTRLMKDDLPITSRIFGSMISSNPLTATTMWVLGNFLLLRSPF